MLYGMVTFFMLLYYMVNSPNHKVRTLVWQVIVFSWTDFSGIMLATATKDVWVSLWNDRLFPSMLTYGIAAIGINSAVNNYTSTWRGDHIAGNGLKKNVIASKSLGGVSAKYVSGSWNNFWGTLLQFVHKAGADWAMPFFVLAVPPWWLTVVMRGSKKIRDYIIFADGVMDDDERVYDQSVQAQEIGAGGMVSGFVTVEMLRWLIGGHLPDKGGLEHGKHVHSIAQILTLGGVSIGTMFVALATFYLERGANDGPPGSDQNWYRTKGRLLLREWLARTTSWGLVATSTWAILRGVFGGAPATIISRVTIALFNSSSMGKLNRAHWMRMIHEDASRFRIRL
jgi:hypothetical protein